MKERHFKVAELWKKWIEVINKEQVKHKKWTNVNEAELLNSLDSKAIPTKETATGRAKDQKIQR